MKKPPKPFAVELRRTGKKIASLPAKHISEKTEAEPVVADWPTPDDPFVSDARRTADRLFAQTTDVSARPASEPADARRVLPSLDEPDFIARLLQEEEANRPRRGRKPGSGLAPVRRVPVRKTAKEIAAPKKHARALVVPTKISGYVRGRIYARYVLRSELMPGQNWRKRLKPA